MVTSLFSSFAMHAALVMVSAPSADALRDGYRDQAGGLIVTFARKVPDVSAGETLGLMYCDNKRCTELITQSERPLYGRPILKFSYGTEAWGDLKIDSTRHSYKLMCTNAAGIDLQPIADDNVIKLGESLKSGKIEFESAPEVRLTEFFGRSQKYGTYVYLDTDLNKNERLYTGAPGVMMKQNFRQSFSRCDYATCQRTLEFGGLFGRFSTHVDVFKNANGLVVRGAIDGEPVLRFRPGSFDLTQLKIPGVPNRTPLNQHNPCMPSDSGTTSTRDAPIAVPSTP